MEFCIIHENDYFNSFNVLLIIHLVIKYCDIFRYQSHEIDNPVTLLFCAT